jgi:hypothetical protein
MVDSVPEQFGQIGVGNTGYHTDLVDIQVTFIYDFHQGVRKAAHVWGRVLYVGVVLCLPGV